MVKLAARAGADVCKFQWVSDPVRLCERRRAPEYLDAYGLIAFPRSWHAELAAVCADEGVEYACTVYLPEDLPVIAPHVTRFKIASFEAPDGTFIAAHRAWGKPLVISTGMMTLAEVRRLAVQIGDILMQCASAYPCPLDQAGLGAIRTLAAAWPVDVGYSDHTRCEFTGGLAVAAGARAVEVHFCDYGTDPGNRDMAVALRDAEGIRAVVLGSAPDGGGAAIVAAVTPDSGLHASDLIEGTKALIKGGGGKDPLLAVAGGKDASGIDAALDTVRAAAGVAST